MAIPLNTPEEASLSFARAVTAGELEAALSHWMPDAILVMPDGDEARGIEEVRVQLVALIDAGAKIEIEVTSVVEGADLALGSTRMLMSTRGAPNEVLTFRGTVVYGRAQGGWRFAIDSLHAS